VKAKWIVFSAPNRESAGESGSFMPADAQQDEFETESDAYAAAHRMSDAGLVIWKIVQPDGAVIGKVSLDFLFGDRHLELL